MRDQQQPARRRPASPPQAPPLRREIYFELKDDLLPSPGGSALAHPLVAGTPDTAEDAEFTVYDVLGVYRGRGKDTFSTPHNAGSRGRAVYNYELDKWTIAEMQPSALLIHGLLTGALATTDSTFTIDGVTVLQPIGGIITNTNPAANVTINNLFDMEGDNNGEVLAEWNEDQNRFDASQVECKSS